MTATASALSQHAALDALSDHVDAGTPCMLWGPAGVGKSDMGAQTAKAKGLQLVDIRLPLMESVDLRGLPVTDHETGTTRFLPPAEFKRVLERPTLIIWDEINAAPMSVQVCAYQAILNNRIGDFDMGPDVRHIAAGNRISDAAGANRMSSALANRMAHVDVAADFKAWTAWALAQTGREAISPLLVGFLNWRTEWLHKQPKDAREFASPRSWTMANRYVGMRDTSRRRERMSECVGEAAASEFHAFAGLVESLEPLPYIIANPETARVPAPDQIGQFYGVTAGLASHVDKGNCKAAVTYIRRLPQEYQALFAKLLLTRSPAIATVAFANILPVSGAAMI